MKDDIKSACNLINSARIYARKCKRKNLIIKLFKKDNYIISAGLGCTCSLNNTPSYDHCLIYKGRRIYPTTNNKLTCTNAAALLKLEKHRDISKKYYRNKK